MRSHGGARVRIAVDVRELQGRPTGVGRYVAELLRAWEALPEAHAHTVIRLAPTEQQGGTGWEQLTLPHLVRDAAADVLFAPAYTGPLRCPVPMVVAIHDLSYAAHPEWYPFVEGARRRTLTRLAARRAVRVLTISQFSKREIVGYLDVEPEKIRVIYPGVSAPAAEASHRGSPTILYVGSIFNRRFIPQLVEGFGALAARYPEVRLEIVGDNRTAAPRLDIGRLVAASRAADRIAVRTYAPEGELAGLYARARAFVFLSSYEGFGFTPLEALSVGLPVVVLDTPVAREVYGDAVIYVPAPQPALIEAALERALFDEDERGRLLAAAGPVLARYSWSRCAAQVLDELARAGRR
jgi:glycosyltransferase involved in cell wall biosynthesis